MFLSGGHFLNPLLVFVTSDYTINIYGGNVNLVGFQLSHLDYSSTSAMVTRAALHMGTLKFLALNLNINIVGLYNGIIGLDGLL